MSDPEKVIFITTVTKTSHRHRTLASMPSSSTIDVIAKKFYTHQEDEKLKVEVSIVSSRLV